MPHRTLDQLSDLCAVCCSIVNTGMTMHQARDHRAELVPSMETVLAKWPTITVRQHPGDPLPLVANTTVNGTRVCALHVPPDIYPNRLVS